MVAAVRTVAAGDALLDPRITRRLIQEAVSGPAPDGGRAALSSLTDREVEVLEHVARGRSNAEIAAAVYLSEATVKTYLSRVMTKTTTRSRAQLVVLAYETGLVRPGDAAAADPP
jgi:DNA-binding NarL/FixJ family response regulator